MGAWLVWAWSRGLKAAGKLKAAASQHCAAALCSSSVLKMPATSKIHNAEIYAHGEDKKSEVSPAAEEKKFYGFCDERGYLDQIEYIIHNGHKKGDRTGTGVVSVFGTQARYSLRGQSGLFYV